jgi:hypothetical protein
MKSIPVIYFVAVCAVFGGALGHAPSLSETDRQFLAGYEKVRSALAADDLANAKAATGDLHDDGVPLAKSSSLKEARAAFDKLSDKAKKLVAGQSGYYVVNCPMLKKDWVQTSEKIGNPYSGKEMAGCGEIKK